MRSLCLLLLLLLIPSVSHLQTIGQLTIANRDTLYSPTLRETRTVTVHLPLTPPDDFDPHQKYPVIYVLDGETLFLPVVTVTEMLGGGGGNFGFPKAIVVGINNTDRTRDLTPTHSTDGTVMPSFLLENSGGGKAFGDFMEKEFIPYIEKRYAAAPYRVLLGHSLGGLLAVDQLVHRGGVFRAAVAIDPSLWWDNGNYLARLGEALVTTDLANRSLYLAMANTLPEGQTPATVEADRVPGSLPIRSLLKFDKLLRADPARKLVYKSKYFSDYDHGAVPLPAIYDALPFVFGFYGLNFPFGEFFQPHFANDNLLIDHYAAVSERLGYRVPPPGEFVDAIAHQLLDSRQFERAFRFFKLNLDHYPESYKALEGMGDFYAAKGEKQWARQFYVKALERKDLDSIRAKLK